MLELAEQMSISRTRARALIEEVAAAVGRFRALARAVRLDPETNARVAARLTEVRREFGGTHSAVKPRRKTPKTRRPRGRVKR